MYRFIFKKWKSSVETTGVLNSLILLNFLFVCVWRGHTQLAPVALLHVYNHLIMFHFSPWASHPFIGRVHRPIGCLELETAHYLWWSWSWVFPRANKRTISSLLHDHCLSVAVSLLHIITNNPLLFTEGVCPSSSTSSSHLAHLAAVPANSCLHLPTLVLLTPNNPASLFSQLWRQIVFGPVSDCRWRENSSGASGNMWSLVCELIP